MSSWRVGLLCTVLTAACDRTVSSPSDLHPGTPFVATEADLAGRWQVTGVSDSYYDDEFVSTTIPSPLSMTFGANDLTFEAPCRVCRSATRSVTGGFVVEPLSCQSRPCVPDGVVDDGAKAAASRLTGIVYTQLLERDASGRAVRLALRATTGILGLER